VRNGQHHQQQQGEQYQQQHQITSGYVLYTSALGPQPARSLGCRPPSLPRQQPAGSGMPNGIAVAGMPPGLRHAL
jgi:hypothetical protein